jgi:hypothetical protein
MVNQKHLLADRDLTSFPEIQPLSIIASLNSFALEGCSRPRPLSDTL